MCFKGHCHATLSSAHAHARAHTHTHTRTHTHTNHTHTYTCVSAGTAPLPGTALRRPPRPPRPLQLSQAHCPLCLASGPVARTPADSLSSTTRALAAAADDLSKNTRAAAAAADDDDGFPPGTARSPAGPTGSQQLGNGRPAECGGRAPWLCAADGARVARAA